MKRFYVAFDQTKTSVDGGGIDRYGSTELNWTYKPLVPFHNHVASFLSAFYLMGLYEVVQCFQMALLQWCALSCDYMGALNTISQINVIMCPLFSSPS